MRHPDPSVYKNPEPFVPDIPVPEPVVESCNSSKIKSLPSQASEQQARKLVNDQLLLQQLREKLCVNPESISKVELVHEPVQLESVSESVRLELELVHELVQSESVSEPVYPKAGYDESAIPEPVYPEAGYDESAVPEPVYPEAGYDESAVPEPVYPEHGYDESEPESARLKLENPLNISVLNKTSIHEQLQVKESENSTLLPYLPSC